MGTANKSLTMHVLAMHVLTIADDEAGSGDKVVTLVWYLVINHFWLPNKSHF